jgi:hypothetical protein
VRDSSHGTFLALAVSFRESYSVANWFKTESLSERTAPKASDLEAAREFLPKVCYFSGSSPLPGIYYPPTRLLLQPDVLTASEPVSYP